METEKFCHPKCYPVIRHVQYLRTCWNEEFYFPQVNQTRLSSDTIIIIIINSPDFSESCRSGTGGCRSKTFSWEMVINTWIGTNGLEIECHSEGSRECWQMPATSSWHYINMLMKLKIHRLFLARCVSSNGLKNFLSGIDILQPLRIQWCIIRHFCPSGSTGHDNMPFRQTRKKYPLCWYLSSSLLSL